MYISSKEAKQVNFLKSSKTQQFTAQASRDHAQVVDGILPAGSIIPSNDANAEGITVNAVDVSLGDKPVAIIVEGYILNHALPVAATKEAMAAMSDIKFYGKDGKRIKTESTGE